ncbi:MAG: replication-associated recombination protein A [Phycisphaerae bacterium]|nr:replication-associated recombination protein A [Phycisphaerae bacterium]MDD5381130.1 replication-associated recombination protein A [Phycisphaerae bacterium]
MAAAEPLAVRMRPRTLEEFAGQKHFVGEGKLLRRMLEADRLSSLIFYGPPGTGKTSLARVIANHTKATFNYLSAPAASVNDIRDVIRQAKDRLATAGARTVLFIDEIHRFNRAQQDVLLDDVEAGVLILIGATTENPFFSVNSPLISRSTVFTFESLSEEDIVQLLTAAIADKERGLGRLDVEAEEKALKFLAVMSDGDARKALTALEVGVLSQAARREGKRTKFNLEVAKESIQQKTIDYDGTGDTHYDLASAFQKSMRGSDPDATIYWLARMISGGEDTRFIARRIAVCAAEDVGNADPMATVLAAAAVQISEFVGLPEAQLVLAQAAIYVACAPKSNASSSAIWSAVSDVKSQKTIPVPKHLKDSHYSAAKKLGYGTDYKYPHNFKDSFVPQEYLPAALKKRYYDPKEAGYEKNIKLYLQKLETLIQNSKSVRKSTGEEG